MGPRLPTCDMKSVIKETLKELFESEEFINKILKKVTDKIQGLEDKAVDMERKVSQLETQIDRIQQNQKAKNICIYGLEEEDSQTLAEKIIKLCTQKLNITIIMEDIATCFRIGKVVNNNKPRPTIVVFEKIKTKKMVMKSCKKLKGTKMAITEDLTKKREILIREAKAKFDKRTVYTYDGNIYVMVDKTRYKIQGTEDIQGINI